LANNVSNGAKRFDQIMWGRQGGFATPITACLRLGAGRHGLEAAPAREGEGKVLDYCWGIAVGRHVLFGTLGKLSQSPLVFRRRWDTRWLKTKNPNFERR
jgi:hypothetical protein